MPIGAPGAEVWERERMDEAQLLLRDTPGVTALVYDQECAANLRRKRRRGLAADPTLRIVINEAVCEGCGDCGAVSNCLSVQPVDRPSSAAKPRFISRLATRTTHASKATARPL